MSDNPLKIGEQKLVFGESSRITKFWDARFKYEREWACQQWVKDVEVIVVPGEDAGTEEEFKLIGISLQRAVKFIEASKYLCCSKRNLFLLRPSVPKQSILFKR